MKVKLLDGGFPSFLSGRHRWLCRTSLRRSAKRDRRKAVDPRLAAGGTPIFAAPIGLFLIGAVVLVALPVGFSLHSYFPNGGRRTIVCPENHESVTVELDNKFAFKTTLRGQEQERLQSCSRWPEKGECGQECLAQINPSPENLERLFEKWYQGKNCALRPSFKSGGLTPQPSRAAQ